MNNSNTSRNGRLTAPRLFFAALFVSTLLSGCTAMQSTHQVKLDHAQLREVLMDYHDDQILDNLIRAQNGLPIVHFDFSHITAQVTTKVSPSIGGSRTSTDMNSTTPGSTTASDSTTTAAAGQTVVNTVAKTTALAGGVVHTIMKPFNWGVSADRTNVVNVDVNPVLTDKTIYDAYTKFLRENPGGLSSSPNKPAATDVLLGPKRWRDGQHYWVSTRYRDQIYALGYAIVARADGTKKSETTKALEDFNSLQRQNILSQPH
jgi:hypothetical protein